MSIAASVRSYLAREGVRYDTLEHEHTRDSMHIAQAAHIPGVTIVSSAFRTLRWSTWARLASRGRSASSAVFSACALSKVPRAR